jgi:hypothetical protein
MTAAAASHNGAFPHTPWEAAPLYLARGFLPISVAYRGKEAIGEGWQKQRPTEADLDRLFPEGVSRNLGLLLGEPSGGLLDADLVRGRRAGC